MPLATTTALLVGGALAGAGASAYASNKAASAQKSAANRAAATQRDQYAQTRGDLAPYRQAGSTALGQLSDLYGLNGADARTSAMSNFYEDPGAAYARSRTIDAVQSSNAAKGLGLSGATIAGLGDRLLNQTLGNYNTYLGRLQDLTNVGQNAAAQTGNFGANAASNIANAQLSAGNATAGGYINGANSFNNLLGNLAGAYGAQRGGAFGGGDYTKNPWANPF